MSSSRLLPLLALAATVVAPAAAQARYEHRHLPVASVARVLDTPSPETVVQDDAVLLHGTDAQITEALARIKALGIDRVRVTAGWSVIAPSPDAAQRPEFDDTDPAAYPTGAWMDTDRIVRMANAVGVKVMLDIAFWAPRWATQSPASETTRLRTDIDPTLYARFATAVARRYSGTYTLAAPAAETPPPPPPAQDDNAINKLFAPKQAEQAPPPEPAAAPAPEPLPAVDTFTIWNEPNHPGFIQPQWTKEDGRLVPHSADVYRAMVRAAYPAIKSVSPYARVLIGGTSPSGASEPGRSGVTPLKFIRRFACVDGHWRAITSGACAGFTTIPGDGWAHHAYSLTTLPDAIPTDGDKLPVANTKRLLDSLYRLVKMNRIAAPNANLYLTEYGYETSPPDPQAKYGPERQAQLLSLGRVHRHARPARAHVAAVPADRPARRPGGPQPAPVRGLADRPVLRRLVAEAGGGGLPHAHLRGLRSAGSQDPRDDLGARARRGRSDRLDPAVGIGRSLGAPCRRPRRPGARRPRVPAVRALPARRQLPARLDGRGPAAAGGRDQAGALRGKVTCGPLSFPTEQGAFRGFPRASPRSKILPCSAHLHRS